MLFKEIGSIEFPTIILLHGGGYSYWSCDAVVAKLKNTFHVVTPIIDGHGDDGDEEFISITDSALKVIDYIDTKCNGKVYAIGGLSLGAQITTEVLSKRSDIAEFGIIESALVYPLKTLTKISIPLYKLSYGLMNKRWFSKAQYKMSFLPESDFERYYQDSLKLTKNSLLNMLKSNGDYDLKPEISNTNAHVLIIVGAEELKVMRKSAVRLNQAITNSELYVAPKMRHGELSLNNPDLYVELISKMFSKKKTISN